MSDMQNQFHVATAGEAILVSFYDSTHQVHRAIAHVLGVCPSDENGMPVYTMAYPSPALKGKLASAKWFDGFERVTPVYHVSHPLVQSGAVSVCWGGDIVAPAGDGSRPYFKRDHDPAVPRPSAAQAISAQSGRRPTPTVQSPLINEPEGAPPEAPQAETPGGTLADQVPQPPAIDA